jgi:hypothetical protein
VSYVARLNKKGDNTSNCPASSLENKHWYSDLKKLAERRVRMFFQLHWVVTNLNKISPQYGETLQNNEYEYYEITK